MTRSTLLRAAVLAEGVVLALALLAGWLLEQGPFTTFVPRIPAIAWGVLATIPPVAGGWLLERAGLLDRLTRQIEAIFEELFGNATFADFVVIAAAAGIAEEALFRGVLQPALSTRLGALPGLLGASALFGLAHPVSPAYVAAATALGLYLGVLSVWCGNLVVPMIAHGLYDLAVLSMLARKRPNGPSGTR